MKGTNHDIAWPAALFYSGSSFTRRTGALMKLNTNVPTQTVVTMQVKAI
jgi:hypothetical protein